MSFFFFDSTCTYDSGKVLFSCYVEQVGEAFSVVF